YWNAVSGSGSGSLFRYSQGRASGVQYECYVDITMLNEYGFQIYFTEVPNGAFGDSWYACSNHDFDNVVVINHGGSTRRVPAAFVVTKDLAITILTEFASTGTRSNASSWIASTDIPWSRIEETARGTG